MSWLDEDEIAEVDAVSGSCMIIRRECWEEVGDFDETFFAYQEDSDYCIRARKAGWKVMYVPISSIIHYGGSGAQEQGAQIDMGMAPLVFCTIQETFCTGHFFYSTGFTMP